MARRRARRDLDNPNAAGPPVPVDTTKGTAGDDRLTDGGNFAPSSNDTLLGFDGNDFIGSGNGTDIIDGGAGIDSVSMSLMHVTTDLTVSGMLGSGQTLVFSNGTTLRNIESAAVYLGSGNDTITLVGGDLVLSAGAGRDLITTGAGRDLVYGDDGNDVISGQGGKDDLNGGGGDDRLVGGDDADGLYGQEGNDRLEGGNGADTLNGGKGDDVLLGGAGADTFSLVGENGGFDRVLDFKSAEGDQVRASFIGAEFFENDNLIPLADLLAAGVITFGDTAEGVLIQVRFAPPVFSSGNAEPQSMLLVGVSLDELAPDFLI